MGRDALYLANATVLLTHQIDAAYWHEWELFGLPGGAPLFVLTNLPMVFLVLWGARALALGRRAGLVMSWALVASGAIAIGLHGVFLLRGHDAFRAPVSLGLLAATLALSCAQAVDLATRSRGSDARSARAAAAPAPR
jgi:hypothetical protein